MNKVLSKAVMTRSRLGKKYLKCPSNYKKQRNYCTSLFKKEMKTFYDNIDISLITHNTKFRRTVKPFFSEKHFSRKKMVLFEQISGYIDKFLSPYLYGFRKGYSTQLCLIVMLEKWRRALDNGKIAGVLLTDLSKALTVLTMN